MDWRHAGRYPLLIGAVLATVVGAAGCSSTTGTSRANGPATSESATVARGAAEHTPAPTSSEAPRATPELTDTVTPQVTPAVRPPNPTVTITAREYAFDVPAVLPEGQTTLSMANSGTQTHELVVVRLNGESADQFRSAVANPSGTPPSGTQLRGIGAINPSASSEVTLDLSPATYGLVCFLIDPETGKTHAELGMVSTFTVR
jgi:hypothetical protein